MRELVIQVRHLGAGEDGHAQGGEGDAGRRGRGCLRVQEGEDDAGEHGAGPGHVAGRLLGGAVRAPLLLELRALLRGEREAEGARAGVGGSVAGSSGGEGQREHGGESESVHAQEKGRRAEHRPVGMP